MPADLDPAERRIRVRVLSLQDRGRVEAVDEEGCAACAVRVGEQVEGLQAGRVGEVGCVCVGAQSEGGVGAVFGG